MRLILHFFAIKEAKMCCASTTGPRVCKSRLEEANAGVGGVPPGSPARSGSFYVIQPFIYGHCWRGRCGYTNPTDFIPPLFVL